jgi:predicted dehydrogenase
MKRKLRMGMVGGGRGAFIGAVHRMTAQLDGLIELCSGAFSSDPERSRASGKDLFLPENRAYGTYAEMFRKEKELPDHERMDFVSIVTPNDQHYPVIKMALEAGFPVVCDKPLCFDWAEAKKLESLVAESGLLFGLTHNYSGYPMIKEARHRIGSGQLGKIRKVVAEYPQGWLATRLESEGQKQASWRTDPNRAGASCCIGDIGTHAAQLTEYVTALEIEEVCADLTSFVEGRRLDDDGSVLLRFRGGARGALLASQISIDEENGLKLRVYGERGGLEWCQEEPNTLLLKWPDRPRELLRTGLNYAHHSSEALRNTRLPAGHPEGYIEAFANLYRNFALTLAAQLAGKQPEPEHLDFPGIRDGVRGMAFIAATVQSSKSPQKWTKLPE